MQLNGRRSRTRGWRIMSSSLVTLSEPCEWVFSGTRLELMSRRPRVCYLDHCGTRVNSLVVEVPDSWLTCHEFEPSAAEDPPCGGSHRTFVLPLIT
ncbi:hypothetical protein TNCV_4770861 [Trichonephila clavipes]|nr:hypothetical protein TNCV_4770861 [Trichonephila clavipes]